MKLRLPFSVVALLFIASSVSATVAAPPQQGTLISNGVKIRYFTAGEGEPVVLIHGFSASAQTNWVLPGVFDNLSKHYRVIALDNRGHGMSGKPHEPDKYGPEMVEDVIRLLDALQIQKAHIVGYSMGGFITDKLLTMHPERVISATLGGAGWSRDEDDHTVIEAVAKSLDEGKGIAPLMRALTPPGQPIATDEQIQARNQMIMLTNDQKALAACIRGMLKLTIPRHQLVNNQVPVLAVIGDKDPLKRGVDAMNGVMKNLKIVVVKGGDHVSTLRSSQFLTALNEFLAAHSSRSTAAIAN